MKALIYLTLKKIKNGILEYIRTPSKLIPALILIAIMGGSAFTASSHSITHYTRDITELYAMVFGLYSVIFVLISKNGFHNGASMFTMQDVNLIFTSPLKQNTVLSFGLVQQLGRSLMLGFFILFQSGTVCATYGVGFETLIYILIGYGVTVFLAQMTAMVIYSFTSSDEKKHRAVKSAYTAIIGAFVAYALYLAYSAGGLNLQNIIAVTQTPIARVFPVSGMVSLAVCGAIDGRVQHILFGIGYCVAFWMIYRLAIKFINGDYYEDVLKSTEVSFSAIAARKEGKASENAPKNIKTGKIGLTKGKGASAIAYKHKIENRRSRTFILSTASLVVVAFTIVTAFVFRSQPIAVFGMSIYMMTMTIVTGRWAKELGYPYIYMIPESSYKKLLYMIKGEIPTTILESILCCVPLYFICDLSIDETAGMVIGRISFAFLLITVNLLLQRLFRESDKKRFAVLFYFILVMIFSMPGIITAVAVMVFLPFYLGLALISMAIVNTIVALILAFCCRKILERV